MVDGRNVAMTPPEWIIELFRRTPGTEADVGQVIFEFFMLSTDICEN